MKKGVLKIGCMCCKVSNYVPSTWNKPSKKKTKCNMSNADTCKCVSSRESKFEMHKQRMQRKATIENTNVVSLINKTTTRH
jgi:hypothetical protein